jgi:hypothetical protein
MESTSMTTPQKKGKRRVGATLVTGVLFILGFAVLLALASLAWDYTNSVGFCSNTCHDVHPEEPAAFTDSYHASVKCTECHMGRLGTLQSFFLKVSHARHLPEVLFNDYQRPLQSETLRPANESCERCHWPPAFHGDRMMEIKHFLPDKDNTEKRIYLLLKTGGGERTNGQGYGIHWHIANKVEYIATDDKKQDIRWVRSTLPDGRVVEFNDVTAPLSAEEIAKAPKRTMDCVDCHNRAGHPFPSPDAKIDELLAQGKVSTSLPYAKEELLNLLSASYPDQATAEAAVAKLADTYKTKYPEVAASQAPAIEQAQKAAADLVTQLVFKTAQVTWQSFPDNRGHKDFAGCFRCHDGKHLASDGESIRLQCNICHSIPITVNAHDRIPQLPAKSLKEPDSHLQTNFMADHRFLANDSCSTCHGKITFGSDDSNFCANSACHGRAWPAVQLNAAFPHPIKLEGKHAQVWCFSCHQGVQKPVYECANCHKPPAQHFTAKCESCHSPVGWKESAAGKVTAGPQMKHPVQGFEACLTCHDPAGNMKPAPASHKGYDEKQCNLCHKAP